MKWHWEIRGTHTHVKVYMNGALCGNLTFTNKEFAWLMDHSPNVEFVSD